MAIEYAAAVHLILRVSIGAVVLWAGVDKLLDRRRFERGLVRYRLLPGRLVSLVASALISVELALGVLLLVDFAPEPVAFATTALFLVFASAIAIDLARGIRIPCQCFGSSETELLSWASLLRATLLAGGTILLSVVASVPMPQSAGTIAPSLTIAAGIALAVRLLGLVPQALASLQAHPVITATHRHRMSLRSMPLDGSLRVSAVSGFVPIETLRIDSPLYERAGEVK
jgi:uncharacterized membrane protein YphA (DoxX/SURF4 family)